MAQYGLVTSTKSTYIDQNEPATNFGSSTGLAHRNLATLTRWSFTGFPIRENVPAGSSVKSADLKYTKVVNSTSGAFVVRAIVDPWEENVLTWNIFIASGLRTGTATASLAVGAKGDYHLDVKDIVQEIIDNQYGGNGFFSFMFAATATIIFFSSDDAPTVADRPELTVLYHPPPGVVVPFPLTPLVDTDALQTSRIDIQSAFIQRAQYDGERKLLELQFKNGTFRVYELVPQGTYDAFMAAESKGRYFHANIKLVFSSTPGEIKR